MQFNPTSTNGIVYMTRFYAKANSNDLTTQDITNLSNLSLDEIYGDVAYLSRTLNFDDPNYGDDPYESYTITSGTARYPLTVDGNSASILGVRKVAVADSNGNFRTLEFVGLDDPKAQGFVNQTSVSGVPEIIIQFDKTLILDPTPNYTRASSLRVFYKRRLDQFTSSDTTAEPGFDASFHELVPLMNAQKWCVREGKFSTANVLAGLIAVKKAQMVKYYGAKAADAKVQRLVSSYEDNK